MTLLLLRSNKILRVHGREKRKEKKNELLTGSFSVGYFLI